MARILVVDDVIDTRDGVEAVLRRLGHQIDTANDGEDAEMFIDSFLYDVVVTDIMMPNKNGFDLIRSIKQKSPKTKIVAISGGGQFVKSGLTATLAANEATISLKKPFTKVELVNAVNSVLRMDSESVPVDAT